MKLVTSSGSFSFVVGSALSVAQSDRFVRTIIVMSSDHLVINILHEVRVAGVDSIVTLSASLILTCCRNRMQIGYIGLLLVVTQSSLYRVRVPIVF